jgi:type II secretory pathway pseudopilin PulG
VNLILITRPYVQGFSSKAKSTSAKESLRNINSALFIYYNEKNTYPTNEQIYDLDSLKLVLEPYLEKRHLLNFSFLSYQGDDTTYILKVKVGDKNLVLTPEGIRESE